MLIVTGSLARERWRPSKFGSNFAMPMMSTHISHVAHACSFSETLSPVLNFRFHSDMPILVLGDLVNVSFHVRENLKMHPYTCFV